jgi:membrane fusion protein (multidrug efflux system)
VLFPNPGDILRPGQYARVRAVIRHKEKALLVPQRAVGEMEGKQQVAVVNPDDTVTIRTVKPGETIDSLWVIDEGLNPGERVIVGGLQKVREGVKVTPKPYEETPRAAPAAAR